MRRSTVVAAFVLLAGLLLPGYLAFAWLPGSPGGTAGLAYEAALRGPVRLYGEAGVVGAIGEGGVLPYGHVGVRLRF